MKNEEARREFQAYSGNFCFGWNNLASCYDLGVRMGDRIYCDYCGTELKNYSFFYKLGRFIKEDFICPVCFDEYFKGNLGKDKARKYDSETMKKIEGSE